MNHKHGSEPSSSQHKKGHILSYKMQRLRHSNKLFTWGDGGLSIT